MPNLVRVSKADNLLFKKSTLYKIKHLGKFPELFVKIGGALFVDLKAMEDLIEAKRLSAKK